MLQSQVREREELINSLRDDLARYTRQLADKGVCVCVCVCVCEHVILVKTYAILRMSRIMC